MAEFCHLPNWLKLASIEFHKWVSTRKEWTFQVACQKKRAKTHGGGVYAARFGVGSWRSCHPNFQFATPNFQLFDVQVHKNIITPSSFLYALGQLGSMKHPAMRASNRCARHNGSSGGRPKVDIALAAAGVVTLLVSHLQQSDKNKIT